MSESLDLHTQVLRSLAAKQAQVDLEIRRVAEAKIWDEDNEYIVECLQAGADVLSFPDLVESKRALLHQVSRYPKKPNSSEGMEIRAIRWTADNSESTREQRSRVRAAVGHAVLLSSREKGVNGNYEEQGEDVGECFYALGLALEINESLWFSNLFAKDQSVDSYACGGLYRLLTNEKYTDHVRTHNEAQYNAGYYDGLLASDAAQLAGYNRHAQGMERAFRRKMEEDFPRLTMQAQDPSQSQEVHNLIMGQPTKEAITYREHLMPRVDTSAIETHRDILVLAESFNAFLGQSTIVKSWLR